VKSIKDTSAKYLAGVFNNATALSGAAAANRVVILQFENLDEAKAWRRPERTRTKLGKQGRLKLPLRKSI
jgi:uncharacterized protein (DUF1330 family)